MTLVHRANPKEVHKTEEKETFLSLGKKAPSIMKIKESHKKREDLIQSAQTDFINVVTPFIEKALDVQQQCTNAKYVRRLATSVAYATRSLRKAIIIKDPCSQAHPRHTN